MMIFIGPVYYLLEKKIPLSIYPEKRKLLDTVEDLGWQLGDKLYSFLWFPFFSFLTYLAIDMYWSNLHYPLAGTLRHRLGFEINDYTFTQFSFEVLAFQFLLIFILRDFTKYIFHLCLHRNKRLWKFHILHHSTTQLDWLSMSRAHVFESLLSNLFQIPFLIFFQISPEIMIWIYLIECQFTFLAHANINVKLGFLKYIINSPLAHHWHHSKECIHQGGQNFGFFFLIFDHIFGTFHLPEDLSPPKEYGINENNNYPENKFKRIFFPFT